MNYMPILPIGMFDLFDVCEIDNAFILPQYWGNAKYRSFYCSRKWNSIIIDNAMYEQPDCVEFGALLDIAEELDASKRFIVAPEDFHDVEKTADLVILCGNQYGYEGDDWRLMSILHGSPTQMRRQYRVLSSRSVTAFGLAVSSWRAGFDRAALYTYCGMDIENEYVHAMGLDSILELINLSEVGVESVDTSMPATAAVNRIKLEEVHVIRRTGNPECDPKRVDLLQEEFDWVTKRLTRNNIDLVIDYTYGDYI